MTGDWVERPSFAVVRGYDRTEVDDYLAEQASRENEARGRIQELEAAVSKYERLAESSRRDRDRAHDLLQRAQADRDDAERQAAEIVEAAHVRAAELDEVSRLDRREADELVKRAKADRSKAQRRVREADELVKRAEADRSDAEWRVREADERVERAKADCSEADWEARQIMAAARAEAALLAEESRRDRDDASEQVEAARQKVELLIEDARQQLERFADEVEAAAEDGAAAVMNGTVPHLDEIRRDLEHLEDQRQVVRYDLFRLREQLDALVSGIVQVG